MVSALDSLVYLSSEMLIILDERAAVQFASSSAARLFGFDPVALVSSPFEDLIDPADRAECAAALAAAGIDALDQKVPMAVIRPDGANHECVVSVRPLLEGAERRGWLLTSTDESTIAALVAARTGNEPRFAEASACSPFVIFRLDEKGACIHLNSRWSELTGQSFDSALGRGWLSMIEEGDRKTFRAIVGAAHTAGKGWRHTFRVRHIDGSIKWVEGAADPIDAALGPASGMVGVVVDITSEVRLQRVATAGP